MRPQKFDVIAFESAAGTHPIRIRQSNDPAVLWPGVALMTVLAALIVIPQALLFAYALAVPQARALAAAHPAGTLQLAIALGVWVLLVCGPLRQMLIRARRSRMITIDRDHVSVTEQTLFGRSDWTLPLADYRGLACHLRTTLSGLTHELVLVHDNPANSLVLQAKDKLTDAEIEQWAGDLGLARADAASVYRLRRRSRRQRVEDVAPGNLVQAVA